MRNNIRDILEYVLVIHMYNNVYEAYATFTRKILTNKTGLYRNKEQSNQADARNKQKCDIIINIFDILLIDSSMNTQMCYSLKAP